MKQIMAIIPDHQVPIYAREWVKILAHYREPNIIRSSFELGVSFVPFILLWILACWTVQFSYALAFLFSALNSGFLLRLFCIQHDCGHGSFFSNRYLSDWVGRILGVITLTPYDVWRRTHSIHHSHTGNLDHRGIGDIMTLTTAEYRHRNAFKQLLYRIYRHPLVMFGLGPGYQFFLENRIPYSLMRKGKKYWVSAMGTNIDILTALTAIVYFGGLEALLLVFFPSTIIAASIGTWLFYIQHQFEVTHWENKENWKIHEAALHGSSHFDLPPVLAWFTASIGIHHVHHLYSRIPFYRLCQVLKDHEELVDCNRMTLVESFKCAKLSLWDEESRTLVSFSEAGGMTDRLVGI